MAEKSIGRDIADKLYEKVISDTTAKAKAEAMAESKAMIETAQARTEAADMQRDLAISAKDGLQAKIEDLQAASKRIQANEAQARAEMTALKISYQEEETEREVVSSMQREEVREMETQISTLKGQLVTAEKAMNKQIIIPQQSIPAFNVVPVRNQQGEIISATITGVSQ